MIDYDDIFYGGLLLLAGLLFWLLCNTVCAFFNLILDMIFLSKKTFDAFRKVGIWKTIGRYIREAIDDPNLKGWW